jgi:hypothetical protein
MRLRPVVFAVTRTDRPGASAAHRPMSPHDRQFRTASVVRGSRTYRCRDAKTLEHMRRPIRQEDTANVASVVSRPRTSPCPRRRELVRKLQNVRRDSCARSPMLLLVDSLSIGHDVMAIVRPRSGR